MSSSPILLVDARNLMYRAIFANKKEQGARIHHYTVMMRFMWGWLDKFKPVAVGVFWDAPKKTLWRKKILDEYKVRNETEYFEDIRDDLIFTQAAAKAVFAHLGVWQFDKKHMEADDLIYSACRVLAPKQIIIISTDSDYEQVVFRMQNVQLWNPMADSGRGKFVAAPDHDPAVAKALRGDKSDKIPGYTGIGPVKSQKMARNLREREEFLNSHVNCPAALKNDPPEICPVCGGGGRAVFVRNLLLIDLSLNPEVLKNDLYVERTLVKRRKFDKEGVKAAAKKHKVSGLLGEYDRIIVPFKLILERAENAV